MTQNRPPPPTKLLHLSHGLTSQETLSTTDKKHKTHAAKLMAEVCWMCTESDLFGELDAKHEIWLATEAAPVATW